LSEGRETITNDLYEVYFYEIPYEDLKRQKVYQESISLQNVYYFSQSYHPGWIAYANGRILPHVKVNNWANGWIVDNNIDTKDIRIVFWPQYLEFFGFVLLAGAALRILIIKK
jgi:hypothetical protein